jgi:hypothetical protein
MIKVINNLLPEEVYNELTESLTVSDSSAPTDTYPAIIVSSDTDEKFKREVAKAFKHLTIAKFLAELVVTRDCKFHIDSLDYYNQVIVPIKFNAGCDIEVEVDNCVYAVEVAKNTGIMFDARRHYHRVKSPKRPRKEQAWLIVSQLTHAKFKMLSRLGV